MSESSAELKQSSSSAWDHLRKGLVDSFETLNESIEKAQKELQSEKQVCQGNDKFIG